MCEISASVWADYAWLVAQTGSIEPAVSVCSIVMAQRFIRWHIERMFSGSSLHDVIRTAAQNSLNRLLKQSRCLARRTSSPQPPSDKVRQNNKMAQDRQLKNWPIWERLLEYWIIISWNNQCQNMFCSLLVVYVYCFKNASDPDI